MGIWSLVVCSILTTAELFFIIYSLNPHWLKVALGYSWVLDLTLGVGVSLVMLSTGSVSGLIMSAISGFVLSISLISLKKTIGYRKLKINEDGSKVWIEHPPVITKDNIINFKDKAILKVKSTIDSYTKSKKVKVA